MSPPTKSTISIEDLPPEMISKLFEYLPPKDLALCSMVNRRWHSIHATFKLHRLAALDYQPFYELILWHNSNQPIQETERYSPAMFLRLVEKPLLSNLKHLALSGLFKFDLNELNRFQQLVHLEISLPYLAGKVHLNLPRLRVLAIYYTNEDCVLSIDCPELHTLLYYNHLPIENLLEVKHPETVSALKTNLVDQQLAPFKNVECLVATDFRAISKVTLHSLPRLKELRYDRDIEHLVEIEFEFEIGTIEEVKRRLSEFLNEAKKLRGRDFRFTFAGFNMANVNVDQIDFSLQESSGRERVSNEYFYMKNYHLIEPGALHFIRHVNYTGLLRHVAGEFPRCFSQKFTGIKYVHVDDRIEDPDHLLWFLKSLRFLRSLKLDVELSQEFYDQLPVAAHSLVCLEFGGCYETELQVNFDFIGQFTWLSELMIYQPLSFESFASLDRWLGRLKEASIYVRSGGGLLIQKESRSTVWRVQEIKRDSPTDPLLETENPDELVSFLEGHVSR